MIRLSRKAWNNVIIFAMLIMILLFNTTNNILTSSADPDPDFISLLPTDSVLMTLELGPQKIERIGLGWRTNPAIDVTEPELVEIMANWKNAKMISTEAFDTTNSLIVVVWLAGETKGHVYQFTKTANQTLVYVDKQYYRLDSLSIEQLVLPGVL